MPAQNASHNHEKVPLLAVIITYFFCPLFLALSAYGLWKITGQLTAGQPLGKANFLADMVLMVLAALAFAACCAFAAWRNAIHLMEQRAQVKHAGLQHRIAYFEEMLAQVTDNIPNTLFISDKDGRLWFANRDAALLMKCERAEVAGKTIDRVFTPRSASLLKDRIRRSLSVQAPVITVDRYDDASGPRYMETYHIPLPDSAHLKNTVMVVQKDTTAVIIERERQEQTFQQLVDTLIAVVDRRDPYAAGHSLRVGQVAEAIAQQMGQDDQHIQAAHIAGSLMNLGKIMVPREILIKTTALSGDELMQVRKAILTSADILSLISFQVPVIPTLRQVLERYDGKGVPEGRRGDQIIITARIVAVANSFIALVSPRAHRAGVSVEETLNILGKDSGTVFDPRVVDALAAMLAARPELREALVKPPGELRGLSQTSAVG